MCHKRMAQGMHVNVSGYAGLFARLFDSPLHPTLRIPTVKISADRKSTRLNSSHVKISYAVFCLKKKKNIYRSVADIATYYTCGNQSLYICVMTRCREIAPSI